MISSQLRNVELFCEVVTRQSFSRAAAAIGVSQPSVSQAIQQLEQDLGVELLDRSTRPVGLTPAGENYYEGCRRILEDYQAIVDQVQSNGHRLSGRIRIASIYSIGLLQLQTYVNQYRLRFPEVVVQLEFLHPDEVYARIRADETDIGLVSYPKDGGDLESIPWVVQDMGLIVSATSPLAKRDRLQPADVEGLPFVAFTSELPIRREVDRWLKSQKVGVKVTHQFDNCENIKRAVEIDAGISIIPLQTAEREFELGVLKHVSVEGLSIKRPIGIVHRRHKRLSLPTREFVNVLAGANLSQHSESSSRVSA